MSAFPIKIEHCYLEHQGGTKFYRIIELIAANGNKSAIFNWGKIGTTGQSLVSTGGNSYVEREITNKMNDKTRNGYRVLDYKRRLGGLNFETGVAKTPVDLFSLLGGKEFIRGLGPAVLTKLDSDLYVEVFGTDHSTMPESVLKERELMAAKIEMENKMRQEQARIERQRLDEEERQKQVEAQRVRQNPMFGMF